MGRTELSVERKAAVNKEYIGKIIIFCEGMTEKYYLDYFVNILKKNKYTDIRVETESANGNSRKVLNFADDFLSLEKNNTKYSNYKKYLMFDCDSPKDIQTVIKDMRDSKRDYSLLVSNYLFEVWLLMHFEIVDRKLSKKKIYERLGSYLSHDYVKADQGIIREIITKDRTNVEDAISNAIDLCKRYEDDGKTIDTNIKDMNPFTNVHILIEQFMIEIS